MVHESMQRLLCDLLLIWSGPRVGRREKTSFGVLAWRVASIRPKNNNTKYYNNK